MLAVLYPGITLGTLFKRQQKVGFYCINDTFMIYMKALFNFEYLVWVAKAVYQCQNPTWICHWLLYHAQNFFALNYMNKQFIQQYSYGKNVFHAIQYKNLLKQTWLLLNFFACLHSLIIKFYTFHCHVLKGTNVWTKVVHQIDKIWMVAPFNHFYIKFWVGLCLNTGKHFVLERAQVFLKNSTRDFQNSPPFERLTWFYVTMTGNFDRFQYFNFEQYFLKTKNFFKKLEYCLLFKSTKIGNTNISVQK